MTKNLCAWTVFLLTCACHVEQSNAEPIGEPAPQFVEVFAWKPASQIDLRARWRELRHARVLGGPRQLADGSTAYKREPLSEDLVTLAQDSWSELLATCEKLPPGMIHPMPLTDQLVMVIEPPLEEIRFQPGAGRSCSSHSPTLRVMETLWPRAGKEAGLARHEFPPKKCCFLLTDLIPDARAPIQRQQVGIGFALLSADGKLRFGADGTPKEGLRPREDAWLVLGMDSSGRLLAWFETDRIKIS